VAVIAVTCLAGPDYLSYSTTPSRKTSAGCRAWNRLGLTGLGAARPGRPYRFCCSQHKQIHGVFTSWQPVEKPQRSKISLCSLST